MHLGKKALVLLLLLIPFSHATAVKLTTDHAEYEPSSSVLISGLVIGNDAESYVGASAAINLSGVTSTVLNLTSEGVSFSASVTAPSDTGNHRYTVSVSKDGMSTLVGHGVLKVRDIATIYLSKDKSEYFVGESVVITANAKDSSGDPYSSLLLEFRLLSQNGSLVYSEDAYTNSNGTKAFSLPALSADEYTAVVNDVYSIKFRISAFTASLAVLDSSGSPSSFFRSGDSASFRVNVLKNGKQLTGSESSSYTVTGIVPTPFSTSSVFAFSFRNGTFVYGYNITSGSGKYSVNATISYNSTVRRLYSDFYVNDYKLDVFPVYSSSSFSGGFALGENVTLAVRIANLSSGSYVTNASILLSVYDSANRILNLTYSVSAPSAAGDEYFQTNSLFRVVLQAPFASGRYFVVANASVANSSVQGFGAFSVEGIVVSAYTVAEDGRPKSVFSLDDTVRVKVSAYTKNGSAPVTSLKLVAVRDSRMREIPVSANVSGDTVSFATPRTGGWYSAEVLVNGEARGYASFLSHLYEIRAGVHKNGSAWYGWNYVGAQEDVLLDVWVFSTSSRESADTLVTISSSQNTWTLSDPAPSPLHPFRLRTIGTSGIANPDIGVDVQQNKMVTLGGESVSPLDANASASSSVSAGGTPAVYGYQGEVLNEVQGVTVSIEKIVNGRTGEEVDISRIENGTTDSNGYTLMKIPKPQGDWQTGWYTITLKARKTVGNELVSDSGYTWFEVKTYWVWAYPSNWKWYFSPSEIVNITVEVREVSTYAGVSGINVSVSDVYQYGSEDGYMYSSRRANYTSGSSLTNANGTAVLSIVPQQGWSTGWYSVLVLAGNQSGGVTAGTGFSVRVYDVWGQGVDTTGNYRWAFGVDDNVSLKVYVREPGNWWSGSLAGVNISILKVYDVTTWPEKDITSTVLNGTNSTNVTTSNGAVLNLRTPSGGWNVGQYYAKIKAVNGTNANINDVGNAWFSIRAFDVVVVPIRNNVYSYVFGTDENVVFNITVCKAGTVRTGYESGKWVVTSCTPADTSINNVSISTWNQFGYLEVPVTVVGNGTPSTLSRTMNISKANGTEWGVGWYSVSFKVYDAQKQNIYQSEYAGFSIRLFDVYVNPSKNFFSTGDTASFNVTVCYPNGCSWNGTGIGTDYYYFPVNFSATNPIYGPGAVSAIYSTVSINGTGTYNISPSSSWAEGWYSVSFQATRGTKTQDAWSWFNVKTFSAYAYSPKWQYSTGENVTIRITSTDPSGSPINLSSVNTAGISITRWAEGSYSYEQVSFGTVAVNNVSEGVKDVVISPASGVWAQGYYNMEIPVSLSSSTQKVYASFSVRLFEVFTSPNYNSSRWYFAPSDNISLRVSVCEPGTYWGYPGTCNYFGNTVSVEVLEVYTYDYSTWTRRTIPLSSNQTFEINGTGNVSIAVSNISDGSYNVLLRVYDKSNSAVFQSAYGWFEVKTFEVFIDPAFTSGYYFTPMDNLTFNITACVPGTVTWNYGRNCTPYSNNINVTVSSLRRYDPVSWNYVSVNMSPVSAVFSGGKGAITLTREDLYNSTLSPGQYYADVSVRDNARPEVSQRTTSWFNVKMFEIASFPNTPAGWFFLPSESLSVNVSACQPGTIYYNWNSTKYRSEPQCTPYSRDLTASLVVDQECSLNSWQCTRINVSANSSQFYGSTILTISNSSLPLSRGKYYSYRVQLYDAADSSVSDYTWNSVYVWNFEPVVYSQGSMPSGSTPLNLTVYGRYRNGTDVDVNVSSALLLKYDCNSGCDYRVVSTNWTQIDGRKISVFPLEGWPSSYSSYKVYVNMTPVDSSLLEEGRTWI